jgi:hypothetical protein
MEKSKKLLFIVRGGECVPSCRFRAYAFKTHLEKLGIQTDFFIVEKSKNLLKQLTFYASLPFIGKKYDVVIYQKLTEPLRIWLVSLFNKNVYYDFDDAMFISDGYIKFYLTLKAAPKVIAGNPILHQYALAINKHSYIIPTVIDIPTQEPPQPLTNNPSRHNTPPNSQPAFVISWIGTARNLQYLTPLYEAIEQLYPAHPHLQLSILSDNLKDIPNYPWIVANLWSYEKEQQELAECTIGTMPLTDDAWSRGKCACKALQYLSFGKPVITSPVGINKKYSQI